LLVEEHVEGMGFWGLVHAGILHQVTDELREPFVGRFYQTDGSTISNIISEGSKGAESGDLNMTYAFEWLQPDIDAKDKEAIEEKTKKYRGMATMAVEKSIESMRAMVVDGRIKT